MTITFQIRPTTSFKKSFILFGGYETVADESPVVGIDHRTPCPDRLCLVGVVHRVVSAQTANRAVPNAVVQEGLGVSTESGYGESEGCDDLFHVSKSKLMVEPVGIEPTTFSLQSYCSPS